MLFAYPVTPLNINLVLSYFYWIIEMKHSSSSDWITPADFTATTDVDSRVVNNLSLSERQHLNIWENNDLIKEFDILDE